MSPAIQLPIPSGGVSWQLIQAMKLAPAWFVPPVECVCRDCGAPATRATVTPDNPGCMPLCNECIDEHWLAHSKQIEIIWEEKWN